MTSTARMLWLSVFCAVAAAGGACAVAEEAAVTSVTVEVASRPGKPFRSQPVRTTEGFSPLPIDAPLTRFGGSARARESGTGFFRTLRVDGRWWLIDPDGGRFISRGVNSVNVLKGPASRAALERRFLNEADWAEHTVDMLRAAGFNSIGAWSDHALLRNVPEPLAEARLWNFMAAYGRRRGGTTMKAGHVGYPGDCPFIFDPDFPGFCDDHARQLEPGRNDPWLLGHFSDNEMPWSRQLLDRYLKLPADDFGHVAAKKWLERRHGKPVEAASITDGDRAAFLEFAMDRYLSIVSEAVRRHDPNHLFLGPRLHEIVYDLPEVFRACGRHCDVVCVNYYRAWSPDPDRVAMWARESGRPFIVTEHYAKAVDSGMENTSGAGWLVKTQRDRGLFYQNFAIGLLESGACVGWHWHRYADNDPADASVDPSNRDSNKGIVTAAYVPWDPLLDAMRPLNERVYGMIDLMDRESSSAHVSSPREPQP